MADHSSAPGSGITTTSVPLSMIVWRDVRLYRPDNNRVYLVTGRSGYSSFDGRFVRLARIDELFRPSHGGPLRWLTEGDDAVTDSGYEVEFFADPIVLPLREA